MHAYEVRPRKDKRGFDLICDALPFVGSGVANPTRSATQSVANRAMICVYDAAGNMIETHEHAGGFREW
jgi:hypothetical protein